MLRWTFNLLLSLSVLALLAGIGVVGYLLPGLPPVEGLRDVRLQVPMRVYTADGALIGEFGEKRRSPVRLAEVPDIMVKAFLDAEDDRFYEHPGVDWQGLVRAVISLALSGEKKQGGGTITMQVAREYFLYKEKSYERKAREILLALKIEQVFTKDEILELYLNTIFLGQRAYGVGAAAEVYYGADLNGLTLDQVAMIAGLAQRPSEDNPVRNAKTAEHRRAYVLRRLLEKEHIIREQYDQAMRAPVETVVHGLKIVADAPDVAEMVRADMLERYGEDAYTAGYRVYTTVDSRLQTAANGALRKALIDYDRRHGYRGPERHVDLPASAEESQWQSRLISMASIGGLDPALVVSVEEQSIQAYTRDAGLIRIEWPGLSWAVPYVSKDRRGPPPKKAADIVKPGDIVRVQQVAVEPDAEEKGARQVAINAPQALMWRLAQVPAVQGALVSLSPEDGAIKALVGGFDFAASKFNRATQAYRQPGSNFKPFLYSAALDAGFTPASLINDAPIVFDAPGLDATWRPENYTGEYVGPTRLREALTASRNLVSIRLLRAIGIDYALDYVSRFGFDAQRLPRNLSLALGTPALTPLEVAAGYTVFANGGFRIEPHFISRIETADGNGVMQAEPARACRECESAALPATDPPGARSPAETEPPRAARLARRVINAENCWMMTSIMRDVIFAGTARRALALKRQDLAGKTGTTNDQKDAWFSGFNTQLETTVWVGFDQVQPLGRNETGARAALPMWIQYMRAALENTPESLLAQPPGLVTVRIDPATGLLAATAEEDAIFETFRIDQVPKRSTGEGAYVGGDGGAPATPAQLF